MKKDKPAVIVINFALAAAFAFAVLVIMEQLPRLGWDWYSRSAHCWPLVVCFIGGLYGRAPKRLRLPLLFVSCLIAGAIMYYVFPQRGGMDTAYIIFTLAVGAAVYFIGLRGDEPFPPKLAVASMILYLFASAWFYIDTGDMEILRPLSFAALGAFLLSLYSFNSASLLSGIHNTKGGAAMRIPSGMRVKNILLLTLFLVIAVPLASLPPLHDGLNILLAGLISLIGKLINAIPASEAPVNQPAPEATPTPDGLPIGETGSPALEYAVGVYVGIMVAVGIIAIFAVIFSAAAKRGGGGRLRSFFRRLFERRRIDDYEDSVERLTDLKGILKKRRDRAAAFFKKLGERPERYADMPDDRARVRFVYKTLLGARGLGREAAKLTPNELADKLGTEAADSLSAVYNRARYCQSRTVTAQDAEKARSALAAMGKRV